MLAKPSRHIRGAVRGRVVQDDVEPASGIRANQLVMSLAAVCRSRIKVKRVARMIRAHYDGVLNASVSDVTNGHSERINTSRPASLASVRSPLRSVWTCLRAKTLPRNDAACSARDEALARLPTGGWRAGLRRTESGPARASASPPRLSGIPHSGFR